jgi:hypothetical protein
LGVASQSATVRVRPAEGWTLTPEKIEGLRAIPAIGERELAYQTDQIGPSPRFILRGPQPDAAFQMISFAEVGDRQFRMTARVQGTLRADRPHALELVLRDAPAGTTALEAPGCRVSARQPTSDGRSWSVEVPTGRTGPLELTLTYTRPLTAATELTFPVLDLRQGELTPVRLEHIVVSAGSELLPRESTGLRRLPDSGEGSVLDSWPAEFDRVRQRGGAVWRVTGDDWRLQLTAASAHLTPASPVEIELADFEATRGPDGWLYRAAYLFQHESGAALMSQLPPGARWVALRVEGTDVPITDPQSAALLVPLPHEAGARKVFLMWHRLDPDWTTPTLAAGDTTVAADAALWTVRLPAGWRVDGIMPLSPAAANLVRAGALLNFGGMQPKESAKSEDAYHLPHADRFLRGTPVRWRAEDSASVRLLPPSSTAWLGMLARFAVVLLAAGAWWLLGQSRWAGQLEQAGLLGLLGAATFGWPEAVLFLILPIIAAVIWLVRFGQSLGWRSRRQAISEEPPALTAHP